VLPGVLFQQTAERRTAGRRSRRCPGQAHPSGGPGPAGGCRCFQTS